MKVKRAGGWLDGVLYVKQHNKWGKANTKIKVGGEFKNNVALGESEIFFETVVTVGARCGTTFGVTVCNYGYVADLGSLTNNKTVNGQTVVNLTTTDRYKVTVSIEGPDIGPISKLTLNGITGDLVEQRYNPPMANVFPTGINFITWSFKNPLPISGTWVVKIS